MTVTNVNSGGIREVEIYPNPSNGTFTLNVSSDFTEQGSIEVTNIIGAKVTEADCTTNQKTEIQMNQPDGIYLINILTPHGRYSGKIVVNN